MSVTFTEDLLEQAYLEILSNLGYLHIHGTDISIETRNSHQEVILIDRFRDAVYKLNKDMPDSSKEEAIKKVIHLSSPILEKANEEFHTMLTDGVIVSEYTDKDGNKFKSGKIKLFDFENVENNDFLTVNQFTIIENSKRRPDIILFINGLPLVLIELKSMSNETVGIKEAYTQVARYIHEIPTVFKYNSFIIISDGVNAKVGTISSNEERYMSFRSVDGINIAPPSEMAMEVLSNGMLAKNRILEIIKDFIMFKDDKNKKIKILAQYHQYFAVKKALEKTYEAKNNQGKIGVVWHTQGSGKSLTMAFYTGQLMKKFNNPTILVVTDRNDLDGQLYETFSKVSTYLGENPKQTNEKDDLERYLNVNSGGIIFSTIQKFAPRKGKDIVDIISKRDDIIIIADEAHRTQYGLDAKLDEDGLIKYGYAKYLRDALPNANFIGFTGTPIDFDDKSTTGVFGNYIDTYDMARAVEDNATVRIYYENRLIKLDLIQEMPNNIDEDFNEIMEGQNEWVSEKVKKDFTKMEAILGTPNRLKTMAKDFVSHWETRRGNAFGKAMIVCTSRRICVDLFNEIILLKPEWYNSDLAKGKIKVVMTSDISKDPMEWKEHFTNKEDRGSLAERMKNVEDELEIVIVRDMWLTGFDVPCMHTMYIDKFMQGHSLMQAIARVNRVYKDKNGGLIVDYVGIASELKTALKNYTATDRATVGLDLEEAVAVLKEHYENIKNILHKFDYSKYKSNSSLDRSKVIIGGMDYILGLEQENNGIKKKFIDNVVALSKAHSLCITLPIGRKLDLEISYFKAVKATLVKLDDERSGKTVLTLNEINEKISQMMANTIISEDVIDVYSELGVKNPDISILTDEFLEEMKNKEYKNLAVEMLKKLLEGKIKSSSRKNLVISEKFSERLKKSINNYKNKFITNLEIMEELVKIAKEFRETDNEKNALGLSDDEVAFYDAITYYNRVKDAVPDDTLILIAKELTEAIRKNMKIDWYSKESVKAEMRKTVKRLLRKHDYPPADIPEATEKVLNQAKLMCEEFMEQQS